MALAWTTPLVLCLWLCLCGPSCALRDAVATASTTLEAARAAEKLPNDNGLDEDSSATENDVTLDGRDRFQLTLVDGAGYSTFIKNGTGKLANFTNYQVVRVDEKDTSFATSLVVAPFWGKLRNGTETYSVHLLPPGSQLAHKILFAVGIFPAFVAMYVALCTLPFFLLDLLQRKHTAVLEQQAAPKEEDALLKKLKDWVQTEVGIEMKPAFKLKRSGFTEITTQWHTQASLCIFAGAQFVVSACFHVRLLLLEPLTASIEIAETVLILLCCVAVVWGSRAATQLTKEGATCPGKLLVKKAFWSTATGQGKSSDGHEQKPGSAAPAGRPAAEADGPRSTTLGQDNNKIKDDGYEELRIEVVLHNHLRFMSLLPFVPTLLFIYWCALSFVVKPLYTKICADQDLPLSGGALFLALYKATELLNNECLLYCVFFKFMMDASLLARVVQSHAEVLTLVIDKEIEEERYAEKKKAQKDLFKEGFMDEVHIFTVKLARNVLPRLSTISGPILAFAVCNWSLGFLRMFRHLASAADAADGKDIVDSATSVLQVLFVHLPIGLLCLLPLAQVSDGCDLLKEKLNQLRDVSEVGDEVSIQRTELYMQGANRGQGLGYELYGTGVVVTKRALIAMFAKAAGLASVVLSASYQIIRLQRSYRQALATDGLHQ